MNIFLRHVLRSNCGLPRITSFKTSTSVFHRYNSTADNLPVEQTSEAPVILAHEKWVADGYQWSTAFYEHSPVVFLHGLLGSKDEFAAFGRELSTLAHRRFYAFDARNHGESERRDIMKYKAMAEDVIATMESIQERSAIFVAHSMGAGTAFCVASKRPDLVKGLVLVDVSLRDAPRRESLRPFLELLNRMTVSFDHNRSLRENRERIADILRSNSVEEFLIIHRVLPNIVKKDGKIQWRINLPVFIKDNMVLTRSPAEIYPNLSYDGPSLILAGDCSDYCPIESYNHAQKFLPNVEFRRIGNAGHFIHYDQPNEFSRHVIDFIKKVDWSWNKR